MLTRWRHARHQVPNARSEPPDASDRLTLRTAIESLPPRQRAAIVLRYYADLSVVDTADAMSCAPGTVKSLCSQAIATLRQRLEEDVRTDETEARDA
jgi:RNA polymerase sigma factor (sigma-70 family)